MPAWSLWDKRLEIPTRILHKYLHLGSTEQFCTSFNCRMWFFFVGFMSIKFFSPRNETRSTSCTGGPSSSCEMIILRNNGHGEIIRVCMGIFTTALRNEKIRQTLNKNTSPYFHSVLLVIWPLSLMKRTHFREFSISRFLYLHKKTSKWTTH